MKILAVYAVCWLLPMSLFAQSPVKGAAPVATPLEGGRGVTRAVVVGISDYQDDAIPDLRFADKDAEAFAAWLRSSAGGSLPDAQVKLLLNKDATTGKMIAAFGGLIEQSKAGDEAIIYFSGHGDVERVTKFQRGYWLTFDSPPAVYAAGAFSLVFLQDIITTLSEAGVQVVVVSDACRAGKLAGSEFGGAQATSAALAKQFANEIKILSCQPDEFSLEGEQWGGGRGCFSYHLVDALYGMADGNADGTVNLLELGRYLDEKVPAETAPHQQIPLTVGNRATRLATVNTETLAEWQKQKTGEAVAFKKTDSKGLEDLLLAKADTSIRELYTAFTAALERGDLMPTDSTAGKSANDFYERLIKDNSIAELHGVMTRNFAAALMDEAQQFINLLVRTDSKALDNMWTKGRIDTWNIHLKLKRAAELLGQNHYAFKTLKAKEHFFKTGIYPWQYYPGISKDSLANIQKQGWLTGLDYDADAPYIILRLLDFYELDSFKIMANHLEDIAPKWVLGIIGIAWGYFLRGEYALSIEYYKKTIATDSTFLPSYTWIANPLAQLGEYSEAEKWLSLAVQKTQEKMSLDTASKFAFEYNDLGMALLRLKRYKEAEKALLEGDRIAGGKMPTIYYLLRSVYPNIGKFEDFILVCEKIEQLHGSPFHSSFEIGYIYHFYLNDFKNAEATYQTAISVGNLDMNSPLGLLYFQNERYQDALKCLEAGSSADSANFAAWFYLAETYRHFGNRQKENEAYLKTLDLAKLAFNKHDNSTFEFPFHVIALNRLGKRQELEEAIRKASEALENDALFHFNMACFYSMTGEPEKALAQLRIAEELNWEPNNALWIWGTAKDPLLDPLRHLPEFQAWEKRWSPPYKDHSKN